MIRFNNQYALLAYIMFCKTFIDAIECILGQVTSYNFCFNVRLYLVLNRI